MGYDHWEACREFLANYEDEQLLAEWDEATRRDLADPHGWARSELWDSVRFGTYSDVRRAQKQAKRPRPLEYPVGRALAAERARARLTQHALALEADMTRDSIARIERNARAMTFEEACKLADVLRVPLDRFRPIE
ncbi:MAG TPA: helix-turn-helix transcriptional regulator [Actinomycetota bacterium]|nr:helix-turn-helix transcriptional regulator [Actinomycetota bacterium]